MPASVEAAAIFALLIVPGYSFLAGYRLGRSHTLPERDLYVVAQAVVVSVLLVALGWFRVDDFLDWIENDTLEHHPGGALVLLLSLIAGPFLIARFAAWVQALIATTERGLALLHAFGLARSDAWQATWATPLEQGALVVLKLQNGETLYGQVSEGAVVDFAPLPPAVYLDVAYREEGGAFIDMDGGAYVPGDQISAVYLAST